MRGEMAVETALHILTQNWGEGSEAMEGDQLCSHREQLTDSWTKALRRQDDIPREALVPTTHCLSPTPAALLSDEPRNIGQLMGKDLQTSFWCGEFLPSTLTLVPDSGIRQISTSSLLRIWMNLSTWELDGPLSLDAIYTLWRNE